MSIQAEIGLNTSPFKRGAQEVKAATERMMKDTQAVARGGGGGTDFALKGGAKGSKALAGLSNDLLFASSGSEILAASLGRVGRIMHLGLGVGAVALLGAKLVEHAKQAEEEFGKLLEKMDAVKQAGANAIEFGGVNEQITALKATGAALAEIAKERRNLGFIGGTLSMFTGGGGNDPKRTQLNSRERGLRGQQGALAQAAIEQIGLEAQIARLKADGNEEDAKAIELAQKKRQELRQIHLSEMSQAEKADATRAVESKYESIGEAAELARIRAQQLATEKEIAERDAKENDLIAERATIGESEEQRQSRLVSEVNSLVTAYTQLSAYQGTSMEHESDALQIAQKRTEAAGKLNELAKSAAAEQKKRNDDDARAAKAREAALPGANQGIAALAAAATGNKDLIREVDRRTRFTNTRASLVKDGFSPEEAARRAAMQTRLEDLKRDREDAAGGAAKGSPGRSTSVSRAGGGTLIERGSDVHADLSRRNNEQNDRMITHLEKLLAATLGMKLSTKPTGPATFARG